MGHVKRLRTARQLSSEVSAQLQAESSLPISQLPRTAKLTGTALVPVVNNGVTEAANIADIAVLAKGDRGDTGDDGASAYDIWLAAGHVGTVADYLDFIKGMPGNDGELGGEGLSAYAVWLAQGNIGTEADFLASLKGEPGEGGAGNSMVYAGPNNAGESSDNTSEYPYALLLGYGAHDITVTDGDTTRGSLSIGKEASSVPGAVAIGCGATATLENAVALGANARVLSQNSVALGADSETTSRENECSVGHRYYERFVTCVRNGEQDTDAATYGQIKTCPIQPNMSQLTLKVHKPLSGKVSSILYYKKPDDTGSAPDIRYAPSDQEGVQLGLINPQASPTSGVFKGAVINIDRTGRTFTNYDLQNTGEQDDLNWRELVSMPLKAREVIPDATEETLLQRINCMLAVMREAGLISKE